MWMIEPVFRDQDVACLAMVGLRGQPKDDVMLFRGPRRWDEAAVLLPQ